MDWKNDPTYYGKILTGLYSPPLKERVAVCVTASRGLEALEHPAICYIAAWHEKDRIIWYEFAAGRLAELLGCEPAQAAEVFRTSVVERRVYKYQGKTAGIKKEVLQQPELASFRKQLRAEVKKTGMTEAVYKLVLAEGRTIWLKDQAEIEIYPQDQTSLALGCLIEVSKEMEAAEERERLALDHQKAVSQVKHLSGLLPICASCKKIRDDQGYWNQIEEYIRKHSDADFSHGFCPSCLEKLYPDLARAMNRAGGEIGGLGRPGPGDQSVPDQKEKGKD
ncbi:MAG: hypothetical protein MUF69_01985 [Desulfobacterota bacterium]|jgi:hypothetical protein|nr:hypothetical protein [Thermodesulfobacteriota bacterium]